MAATGHAFLSPSAAHRWMNCPAAPSLEANVPDKGSVFAEEGTLAHAICEAKLRALLIDANAEILYQRDNEEHQLWTDHELYQPEMEEHTDYYRDVVWNKLEKARETTPDAKLIVEQTLDFRTWIPDGFGTADAVIIADGTMEVIDFKYGKGVMVSAEKNPQMMIYALGALELFENDYNIKKVRMTIVQPRIDNVSEYEIDEHELRMWGDNELKPKAELAYRCKDDEKAREEAKQTAGAWCKFCAIKPRCKALAELANTKHEDYKDVRLLTDDQLAEALESASIIKSWITALEDYTLEKAIEGSKFKGWKLVEGRSVRVITDAAALAEQLKGNGYTDEAIYKPQELKTITALEKLVGKKLFSDIAGDLIVKPQGKPTLAPESDKRKEWTSAADDFAGIKVE